jgi:hypothetical protein
VNTFAGLSNPFIVPNIANQELNPRIGNLTLNIKLFFFITTKNANLLNRILKDFIQNPSSERSCPTRYEYRLAFERTDVSD